MRVIHGSRARSQHGKQIWACVQDIPVSDPVSVSLVVA
jgi:hypothetical protein